MTDTKEIIMKTAILCVIIVLCTEGCSVASSAPDLGAATVTQFTEVSWPVSLTSSPGWAQTFFFVGRQPRLVSTGQGTGFATGTTVEVRSREGDTLVGLAFSAQGNGIASVQADAFAFTAIGSEALSSVFDRNRPPGFTLVTLPLKPHLVAPGEGIAIQLDDVDGEGYEVTAIRATWTRPL